jgi:hypothetical protein
MKSVAGGAERMSILKGHRKNAEDSAYLQS